MKSSIRLGCSFGLLLFLMIPRLGKAQTFTTLMNFTGSNGSSPLFAPLVQGTDGNLYGTASAGGGPRQSTGVKNTRRGTPNNLFRFFCPKKNNDRSAAYAGVIQSRDGKIYRRNEARRT